MTLRPLVPYHDGSGGHQVDDAHDRRCVALVLVLLERVLGAREDLAGLGRVRLIALLDLNLALHDLADHIVLHGLVGKPGTRGEDIVGDHRHLVRRDVDRPLAEIDLADARQDLLADIRTIPLRPPLPDATSPRLESGQHREKEPTSD
jgi:hypothetical protein